MPVVVPAFQQYQAPLVPLRGLWNARPREGDRFINAEIDWVTPGIGTAVQFALSGNSPVALSQIVALSVDNARCGVDVEFLFPDSGFDLNVPAHNQGMYPVFTNALTFYAIAQGAATGDVTVLQVLNSMPPPIPIQPTSQQNHASVSGISLTANATTTIVPAGVSGTLNTVNISGQLQIGASGQGCQITLQDGTGATLWQAPIVGAANQMNNFQFNLPGLALRFFNGLRLVVLATTIAGAGNFVMVNVYYTTP